MEKNIDEKQDRQVMEDSVTDNQEEAKEQELPEVENEAEEGESQAGDEEELDKIKSELQEAKDKYLRLYSEFENFRRRTAKERLTLISTANEELMTALLPIMDDFERGKKAMEETEDHKASKEGFDLIFNKFSNILKQKGLKPMESKSGSEFNTEFHEAISQMPVEKKKMKGKIIDVVEKGYYLDEKVIRFAKVVIGA